MKVMIDDAVYSKKSECVYNYNEALWSNVPMGIIRKYVKNKELRDKALSMKKECTYTLFQKGDINLKRLYRITRFYMSHFKKYRKHYFDKNN